MKSSRPDDDMRKAGDVPDIPWEDKADLSVDAHEAIIADDVCEKAPEWAEHYRLFDLDDPCDDGRQGKI